MKITPRFTRGLRAIAIVALAAALGTWVATGAHVGWTQTSTVVKGITKAVTVPVTLTYLPNKLGARLGDPKLDGDLLVLRTNFEINRNDFDIQPGQSTDKVAEVIHLSLSIAGAARRS
jgi:hypothetical protein